MRYKKIFAVYTAENKVILELFRLKKIDNAIKFGIQLQKLYLCPAIMLQAA